MRQIILIKTLDTGWDNVFFKKNYIYINHWMNLILNLNATKIKIELILLLNTTNLMLRDFFLCHEKN